MEKLLSTALLVLNELTKRKEVLIGIGLVLLVFLGFLIGKYSCQECSKEVVCKTYIKDNETLSDLLKKNQESCMKDKVYKIQQCQKQEAEACKEKIEKYKTVYRDLKCSICKKKREK